MPIIQDDEFGKIIVRRSALAGQIRLKISSKNTITVTAPSYAPMFLIKNMINNSRAKVRHMLESVKTNTDLYNGMQIGKSHTLIIRSSTSDTPIIKRSGLQIIVSVPDGKDIKDTYISNLIHDEIKNALKIEAKNYLRKRIKFLADKHGFRYEKIRFSHASTRWGSCSNNKTISLNIALMKLDFELIDYVLIHELSHLKHMNHGKEFWNLVGSIDNSYQKHRKLLKLENPSI